MTATPATDRRLVVYDGNTHEFHAIPPNDATGIPLTAFQVVNQIPVAGTNIGEAIFVESIRAAYVWDGRLWREVTASPIRNFPDELQLQANTTEPTGTYAVALNTGGMFVKAVGGWRRIGISEFASYADLAAFTPPDGSQAIANDLDVVFLRLTEGGVSKWVPITQMVKPAATILATPNIQGLVAIASDTGDSYVNNGTRWVQDPIEHYATEAALLAVTPIDGHLAWSDDTNIVFVAAGGRWKRLAGPQIALGATAPATPGAGDAWFDTGEKALTLWDGAIWQPINDTRRMFTANVTMGANATAGAEVVLLKGIKADSGSIYINICDNENTALAGRYAIHAFARSSNSTKVVPISISAGNNKIVRLGLNWKGGADQYVLTATIGAAAIPGTVYRIGLMGPNTDLSDVVADGNTNWTAGANAVFQKVDIDYPAGSARMVAQADFNGRQLYWDSRQNTWIMAVKSAFKIDDYVPVGNLVKVEVNCASIYYHGTTFKLRGGVFDGEALPSTVGNYLMGTYQSNPVENMGKTPSLSFHRTRQSVANAWVNVWIEIYMSGSNNMDSRYYGGIQVYDLGPVAATPALTLQWTP